MTDLSATLDNARKIGKALTESEIPSLEEFRPIVGALLAAKQAGVDIADDDAVNALVSDLERLKAPLGQQVDGEGTIVHDPVAIQQQEANSAEIAELRESVAATNQAVQQIAGLLAQGVPAQAQVDVGAPPPRTTATTTPVPEPESEPTPAEPTPPPAEPTPPPAESPAPEQP